MGGPEQNQSPALPGHPGWAGPGGKGSVEKGNLGSGVGRASPAQPSTPRPLQGKGRFGEQRSWLEIMSAGQDCQGQREAIPAQPHSLCRKGRAAMLLSPFLEELQCS